MHLKSGISYMLMDATGDAPANLNKTKKHRPGD